MAGYTLTLKATSHAAASTSKGATPSLSNFQAISGSAGYIFTSTRSQCWFSPYVINDFLRQWTVRGPQIVAQLQAILQLAAASPVDLSPVIGPAVLIEQAISKVMRSILAFMMNDPCYPTWSLDTQHSIAKASVLWDELYAVTGNVAFYDKFPGLGALLTASPSAQLYSAQARAIATAVDTRLESFLSVPTLAGLTVQTFWSTTQQAVAALSRLLVIDYVISSDPTVYYGPHGTIENIITDLRRVLHGMGPLTPSVPAVLTQIKAAVAAGYTDTSAISITSIRVPGHADIQQLASQIYGDPDMFKQLADFNGLAYPYISDDPVAKLGPPKQLGVRLTADMPQGTNTITLTSIDGFAQDDRILFQYEGHVQVVTITSMRSTAGLPSWDTINIPIDSIPDIDTAFGIAQGWTFNWDTLPPALYDLEAQTYAVQITPATDIFYGAANTMVTLYPAIYDAGVVLGTGDTLLIPNVPGQSNALIIDNNYTDTQRLGTDAAVDQNGNLNIVNGDLATVTGLDNLKQALLNRFKVERGTLIHHPQYGTGLLGYLGRVIGPTSSFAAIVDATQTVLQDPRVSGLSRVQAVLLGDAINIGFNVSMANGVLAFPTNLELTVPLNGGG